MKKGDRVRIVGGPWASDCGEVVKVLKKAVKVKVDTGGKIATINKGYLEAI